MLDPDEKAPQEPTPDREAEQEYGTLGEDLAEKYQTYDSPRGAGGSDVPAEVAVLFWSAVIFANVAVLALSLGVLVIWFLGRWQVGVGLLLAGVLALLFTYRQYWRFENDEYDTDDDG